ncbi:L-type lectin-domain containing receptor kinase V.9-like [Pyrus communis]|uniref:L-type lectin-domain containing receptor kinase V.9-like n=1 Tax=Pyrus communis TaxID=23211 RepID=UPI0035C040DE
MATIFFKFLIFIQATLAAAQNIDAGNCERSWNGLHHIAPKIGILGAGHSPFLDLFNLTNNGNVTNHIFAVELDATKQIKLIDIDNNHVGIDINGLNSVKSSTARYYAKNNGGFRNLSLTSGQAMQVWVEYDGTKKQINVTLAPVNASEPHAPFLSLKHDLSPILLKSKPCMLASHPPSVSFYVSLCFGLKL